jgi:hypothetical protein
VLLEGPAIEPLLAQVRQEYGPSARIISADKIRTGGVGGFFTRQRYELSIEIDDDAVAPAGAPEAPPAPAEPVEPIDALLALVEASQDELATAAPAKAAPAPAATAAPAPVKPPRAGLVSTTNPGFAEILAGLQGGLAGTAGTANSANTAGTAGNGWNGGNGQDPADGIEADGIEADGVEADGATAPPPAAARRAGNLVRAYRPENATATTGETRPRAADLAALGVPERLARRGTDADPYRAALQALANLAPPPAAPDRPGDVLVVAGELAHALPIARQVAADLRLDPAAILLAGPSTAGTGVHPSRRISGPSDAERKARRLHRDDVPHVVVLDVPFVAEDNGWARDVCDALGASAVWAVVDATRKTADTARHLRAIGDVDALAVHGARVTADPASPLGLSQPVALLEGRPATAQAWAALLAERLQPPAPAVRGRRRRSVNREGAA